MRNGQLKPGYNLQISTCDQFILHYSLHRKPGDTTTLIPHLESFKQAYNTLPRELTADAGYGSEENYLFLEANKVDSYVKYNTFDIAKKHQKKQSKYPFALRNLHYDPGKDVFYCPTGQPMGFIGHQKLKTKTGFEQKVKRYQAINCEGCQLRASCHKSKHNRIVQVNERMNGLREKAKKRLESERGIQNRKQRPVDVEPVFGHIKYNRGFKRFMLRGLDKVNVEAGLLAIAHNLKKIGA